MDILNFITQPLVSGTLKAVGVIFAGAIAIEVRKFIQSSVSAFISKLLSETNNIKDENIRQMARHAVRYVASQMPEADNNEKLQEAIRKVQEATPDIIVSDEKVKLIVESEYSEFKRELKSI
jgi:mevalonate kinase